MKVVTRFAPSQTGEIHMGSARTALFNHLFAKHHGGEYKLRIEDTDKTRSTQTSLDSIFKGLSWLGIQHDGDPVFQSQNAVRHREVAFELEERGYAYRDYTTPDQMAALRDRWDRDNKSPFRYLDNPWRANPAIVKGLDPFVLRFKAPRDGETVIDDAVQGRVTVQNHTLDDMILLRSDGSPTYMLAVVVDDYDAEVSHIIRGDDHLNNAFRQVQIIRAMDWEEPIYAHIPLIHDEHGKKYSKRSGAVAVSDFADQGILSDAMVNYLVKLGWGHGNDEIISREQMVEWFDLPAIGRAPARFDMKKLLSVNTHYLREMSDTALASVLVNTLGLDNSITDVQAQILSAAVPSLKPRVQTINEMVEMARFYIERPKVKIDYDFNAVLASFPELWERSAIEQALRDLANALGIKLKDIVAEIRLAITGSKISPPLFESMELLGREEVIARLVGART